MRSALLAVALSLVLASAAHAGAIPPAGTTVGGGDISFGKAVVVSSITLRVGDDGRSLRLAGNLAAPCVPKSRLYRHFVGSGRIADDGSFDVTARSRFPDITGEARGGGRVRVKGTFDSGSASGTLQFRRGAFVVVNGRRRSCRSKAGTFEARDPSALQGRATKLVRGQKLYGYSEDRQFGLPMAAVVRVAPKKRRLTTVYVGLRAKCPGEPRSFFNYSPFIPVKATGAFRVREQFPLLYTNARSRYRVTTSGRLAEGGIVGRIHLGIRVSFTKGRSKGRVQRCPRAGSARFAVAP